MKILMRITYCNCCGEPRYGKDQEIEHDEECVWWKPMKYHPDNWVVLKINRYGENLYKVLAGWSGSYLHGDSWRLNSGIVEVNETEESFEFIGHSGSVYVCHKGMYGLRMNNAHVVEQLKEVFGGMISVMDENTDWKTLLDK